ncbi:MAG: hypothetical protein HYU51_02045 [Candidatus Rokubacteria bacterium]|nr:hypothetical protein [Candidatus Rokubacteria bacterium]
MAARFVVSTVLVGLVSVSAAAGPAPAPPAPSGGAQPAAAAPGTPAPPEVVAELQQALAHAVDRFERMDAEGVLASVSDRYRTGPLTKPALRQQLLALFATYDALHARVRIDGVRMIDGRAWVTSTGEVTGRLRWLGTPMTVLAWTREPEVAWREAGRWRLIGDQQP